MQKVLSIDAVKKIRGFIEQDSSYLTKHTKLYGLLSDFVQDRFLMPTLKIMVDEDVCAHLYHERDNANLPEIVAHCMSQINKTHPHLQEGQLLQAVNVWLSIISINLPSLQSPIRQPIIKETPKPPLEIIDDKKVVSLKKHPHLWVTKDGKIGVPKKTEVGYADKTEEVKKEVKVAEVKKEKVVKKKKKRKKKRAKVTDEDFERIKAFYYLFSIALALLVIVLMCVENTNILWIIIALFGPVTYFVMLFKE